MFEARIKEGIIFKKLIDSIKELVKNVCINANGSGL